MSQFDIIFVLPYLFSDHPSFPEGILKRILEKEGFRVGVIEQPFWQKSSSFSVLGKPKYFFAVISGPVDSTVLNYTSTRKRRYEDLYQLEGDGFFPGYPDSIKYKIRPDNSVIVFSNKLKEVFKDVPIVIGGVEATLRQFTYYDFQKDKIRRPILFDSRASLMVTGPGEKQLVKIAKLLRDGEKIEDINLNGTSKIVKDIEDIPEITLIPSYDEILSDKKLLVNAFLKKDRGIKQGNVVCQKVGDRYIAVFPNEDYKSSDLDLYYSSPFKRVHLSTKKFTPALRMNLFSITSHRGCEGGCSFCSISLQEGKRIISRSFDSIRKEVESLKAHPEWRGVISDIGGPSAEMFGDSCSAKICLRTSCIFPGKCSSLERGDNYLKLLRDIRSINGVKKVFLGSGLRYDNLTDNRELLEDILEFHSGKFLRIAPEHTEKSVLDLMGKPEYLELEKFIKVYRDISKRINRKIELSPYLIIGHPGETLEDLIEMKRKLKYLDLKTSDVQIFTPTPGTLSTAMYYSETDLSENLIPVEKNIKELIRRKKIIIG